MKLVLFSLLFFVRFISCSAQFVFHDFIYSDKEIPLQIEKKQIYLTNEFLDTLLDIDIYDIDSNKMIYIHYSDLRNNIRKIEFLGFCPSIEFTYIDSSEVMIIPIVSKKFSMEFCIFKDIENYNKNLLSIDVNDNHVMMNQSYLNHNRAIVFIKNFKFFE